MAKKTDVAVIIKPEADFGAARRDIATSFRGIEKDAKDTVATIERTVDSADLSPKVDLDGLKKADTAFKDFADRLESRGVDVQVDDKELRQAFDIAEKLKNATARLNIDTDADELKEAERLAQSLRNFTGRVRLDVEGRQDLRESLGLAEQLDQIRQVKVDVQGRQELERANQLADNLEKRRQINIDPPPPGALDRIDQEIGEHGGSSAELFSEKFGDFDFGDVGGGVAEGLAQGLAAAGPWAAAAASVVAIFGDEFAEGFSAEMSRKRSDTIRAISSGLGPEDMRKVGDAAGAAFSDGLGGSLAELRDDAAILQSALGGIDDDLDLTQVTKDAEALAETFHVDVAESVEAVRQLVAQGLVKDSQEGFDLLVKLGQQTGSQFGEMIESSNEFGNALDALGIQGARGLGIIGETIRQDIFPQVDQAGELFEEFYEIVSTGQAAEALEEIGFNAEVMQRRVAGGGKDAAAAMAEISERFLTIRDDGLKASASTAIFGSNIARVGDKDTLFGLLATVDGFDKVDGKATEAAKAIADSKSSFEEIKIAASQLGGELAHLADKFLGAGQGATGLAAGAFEGLKDFGSHFDLGDKFDAFTDGASRAAGVLGPLSFGMGQAAEGSQEFGRAIVEAGEPMPELIGSVAYGDDKLRGMDKSAQGAADSLGNVATSAEDLRKELDRVFDFDADQILREIKEQGDQLAETFKENGRSAVGLAGAIDITKKGGSDLQEQFERLSGSLSDAAVKFKNSEITADQFRQVQAAVEAQFGATTRAAGLTTSQVEGLRQKYIALPTSVTTSLNAVDNATGTVTRLQAALREIKDKNITITAKAVGLAGLSGIGKLARGGPARGLTLVGEEGPELVDFQAPAYVYNATETKRLVANMGRTSDSSTAPTTGATAVNGSPLIGNATIMVSPGRDLWQELRQAEAIYSVGLA